MTNKHKIYILIKHILIFYIKNYIDSIYIANFNSKSVFKCFINVINNKIIIIIEY